MSLRISPRPTFAFWAMFGLWAALLASPATGIAQMSAEESARKLKPMEGFEATLWASEPLVFNPTNMDIDSRGRVWISEGLNYRFTHGKKSFPRIEEADRIKILEDTDGDGKADKVTVFADRIFPIPMGLAVEEKYGRDGKYLGCKVYVGNSPDLLVLEDTDGDDKADKRYSILTGFGGVDSDHGVHGMVLGLDGKLYFTHGDGCCSYQQDHSHTVQNFDVVDRSGRHVSSDQLANTLRVNRDGTRFEILADRQRNNYETCLNSFGNVFTSDNDDDGNRGSRVIWVMDGGAYGYRTPGSPRHWGEEVPGNVPKLVGTGNGSPCGIMAYEGSLFPKEFYGALLEAEAGTRQINFLPITRKGAAFRTDYRVLLASDDPWFRPVDMTAAPDGSVFVADWYDAGVGGHNFQDQTTGRIYRIVPKGAKPETPRYDFGTNQGLLAALQSPVVAAQDAARRSIIERARDPQSGMLRALEELWLGGEPRMRARALWVLHAIRGDRAAEAALKDKDPQIREQAVRILGRDVADNGHVEYKDESAIPQKPALKHLSVLLPLAADPDSGVRRELILAIRNLTTDDVGAAIKKLAKTWDGQDRWYLEALGLALDHRDPAFLSDLFDGKFYGNLNLDQAGQATRVAVPPYFPVDRNEAYIVAGTPDLPASPLTKTLGLAWRVHQPVVLPLLSRIAAKLATPDLQQAADDVVLRIDDPSAALALADEAADAKDPARRRQALGLLARKLDGSWREARTDAKVIRAIEASLREPETRLSGIDAAASAADARYGAAILALARDPKSSEEIASASVEALGRLKPPGVAEFLHTLIAETKGRTSSNSRAEAALRALPRVEDPRSQLVKLITSKEYPLGLRREALRTFARLNDGGFRVLALAKDGKLPAELKTEATSVVHAHADRRVRDQAATILPQPKTASGRPLPSIGELIRREGNANHGRDLFFRAQKQLDQTSRTTCGGCHRVQGQGDWVGPDLSTIGTKYGRDELLRSILNPSAAIGYNYRTTVVATKDGQVITGLPVEDSPDRLVIKTAERQRVTIRPSDVEERANSDVSLMPEGLAETMSDQDLVDLLVFLSTLRSPVSVVGQYHVLGPLADAQGAPVVDPAAKIDPSASVAGPDGKPLSWRRVDANAEGRADLTALAGDDPARGVYVFAPVASPVEQDAQLVLDTKSEVKAWLNGKPLVLPQGEKGEPRIATVHLAKGSTDLLIRLPGGPDAALVTTLVADRPIAFTENSAAAAR